MFKALFHWVKQAFGSAQHDQPGVASLQQSESNSQMAGHFDSIDSASHVVPYDENLLERVRTQWQFGDWESLSQLSRESLQHHPDRAKLALLAASGHMQTGQTEEARQLLRMAQDWGANKQLVTRVLVAGVHNSLGRSSAAVGDTSRAMQHFQSAITTGTPGSDARLLTQARVQQQFQQLQLLGLKQAPDSFALPLNRVAT
jgi:thioredoxin-like negative regulator of GroEL